jgi:hypothetical protein
MAKKRVKPRKSGIKKPSSLKISPSQFKELNTLFQETKSVSTEALLLAKSTISRIIQAPKNSTPSVFDKALFVLSNHVGSRTLRGYSTLDASHIENIEDVISKIKGYTEDSSQKRPLNFLMLASPGAGKSHFIECIAKSLGPRKIQAITFNMTALQTNEDLIPAIDAARNMKVQDHIPLLFLDEFDSNPSNIPLLLPLLWDGGLNLGQRDLKLGRSIVVLAGSDPLLPGIMDSARSMRSDVSIPEDMNPKIVDLLSRINGGVVEIPAFFDPTHSVDRRADKVCIAIHLLKSRFGDNLKTIPRGLLQFVINAEFRYGARSISHLIELIPHRKNVVNLRNKDLKLPLQNAKALKQSSLAYHLINEEQVLGVINLWESIDSGDVELPAVSNIDDFFPAWLREGPLPKEIAEWVVDRLSSMSVSPTQARTSRLRDSVPYLLG